MNVLIPVLLSASLIFGTADQTAAAVNDTATSQGPDVSSASAVLMEPSTGTVIYEKNSTEALPPASITKIMTLILIFDAIDSNRISYDDEVTVSSYAASMGGSQVFLEAGEVQTVDTLIKCISVASANDACVAMAEYIAGTESEFVRQMNERATSLGMNETTFKNCCGLDTAGHVTSAYDIALMSAELITRYPQIYEYCNIWMENITHSTARGVSEFTLTNTNKLIRQYEYATGLKTGSTGLAKYCVSATANKNDMDLVAVIMAAPDSKSRFNDAAALLNYGFSKCELYVDDALPELPLLAVKRGVDDYVTLNYSENFRYLSVDGSSTNSIESTLCLPEYAVAPFYAGDAAGEIIYTLNGEKIGSVDILYEETVECASYKDYFKKAFYACLIA